MAMNDPLANALSHILNCEKIGKKECELENVSKTIRKVVEVMEKHDYVKGVGETKTKQGVFLKIKLLGNINKCGVVKPRFSVKKLDYEKYEKRFLPAKNFGILIISTNKGIMTHNEAIKNDVGGRLIAYIY